MSIFRAGLDSASKNSILGAGCCLPYMYSLDASSFVAFISQRVMLRVDPSHSVHLCCDDPSSMIFTRDEFCQHNQATYLRLHSIAESTPKSSPNQTPKVCVAIPLLQHSRPIRPQWIRINVNIGNTQWFDHRHTPIQSHFYTPVDSTCDWSPPPMHSIIHALRNPQQI